MMRSPSSYIYGGVHSLNSWWGLLWMWEEETQFFRVPGVPKNFPVKEGKQNERIGKWSYK